MMFSLVVAGSSRGEWVVVIEIVEEEHVGVFSCPYPADGAVVKPAVEIDVLSRKRLNTH